MIVYDPLSGILVVGRLPKYERANIKRFFAVREHFDSITVDEKLFGINNFLFGI